MESARFIATDGSTPAAAVMVSQSQNNHAKEEGERILDEMNVKATTTTCASATWNRVALVRQLLAASGAVIGSISFGMTTGFSATLLPNLKSANNAASIDRSLESWIASSVVLSMLIGVISGSVCMRYLGRRPAQLYLYVSWICGWLTVSYSSEVFGLLAGCLLVGSSAGSHVVVSALYIGEICEPRFRGVISIQVSLGVAAGILASHAQGLLFDWRTALRMSAALPIVALALVLAFAYESPTWLAFNGRVQSAKKVFLRLRNEIGPNDELNALIEAAAAAAALDSDGLRRRRIVQRYSSSFRAFRASFSVLSVLFVVQQGSGLNAIVFYAVTMLEAMGTDADVAAVDGHRRSAVDISSSMIIVDTVRFFASLVACVLIKVTGRRELYFWSAAGSMLSLCAVIACTIYRLPSVMIFFTCAYIAFLYVGVSPIPWIMVGELYPTNLKEFGICISSFFCFLTMFAVVKTALYSISLLGTAVTFAIYVAIMLVGVIFLFYRMPETNNITLQQIEKNLSRRRTTSHNNNCT